MGFPCRRLDWANETRDPIVILLWRHLLNTCHGSFLLSLVSSMWSNYKYLLYPSLYKELFYLWFLIFCVRYSTQLCEFTWSLMVDFILSFFYFISTIVQLIDIMNRHYISKLGIINIIPILDYSVNMIEFVTTRNSEHSVLFYSTFCSFCNWRGMKGLYVCFMCI